MTHYRVIDVAGRSQLGEGPVWSLRDRSLYWVDILSRTVQCLSFDDGRFTRWQLPETIAWLIERKDAAGFVAGLTRDIVFLNLEPLRIARIACPEPDLVGHRLNDAKADAWGRIWAGTMPIDGRVGTGALYRIDADGAVTRCDSGYRVANGPAFSPDGRYLYHSDSLGGIVYRFAVNADGSIGDREPFIRVAAEVGAPDGMTVDAEGGIWIAVWGGSRVSRYSSNGLLDCSIELPASQITSCTFAGARLDRLYVTSASVGLDEVHGGALFEVDPGVTGLPAHRFAG